MLALSADDAAKVPRVVSAAGEGLPSLELLTRIYDRTAERIGQDLHAWVAQGAPATVQLPRIPAALFQAQVSEVSPLAARVLLGQILLSGGAYDRAEALFRNL